MPTVASKQWSAKNGDPTNNVCIVLNTDGTTAIGVGTDTPAYPFEVIGAAHVSGAFTHDGSLVMSATTSKLVPGATSFSVRNHADSADNLLVADNGDVTVRRSLILSGVGDSGASTLNDPAVKVIPNDVTSLDDWTNTTTVTSLGSANPGPSTNTYRSLRQTPTISGTAGLGEMTAVYGVSHNATTGSAGTGVQFGTTGRTYLDAAFTGTVGEIIGLYGSFNSSGAGTVTTACSLQTHTINEAQGTTTITDLFGVKSSQMTITTLTVTNAYGMATWTPTGASGNNVGIAIGAVISNTTAMLYGTLTISTDRTLNEGVHFDQTTAAAATNYAHILTSGYFSTTMNHTGTSAAANGINAFLTIPTGIANGTITVADGVLSTINHGGTGTITVADGYYSKVQLRTNGTGTGATIGQANAYRAQILNLCGDAAGGQITVGNGLKVEAPSFTGSNAASLIASLFGVSILNQGHAQTTNSWGMQIAAQSGASSKSWALQSLGGYVAHTVSATIASASGAVWAGFNIPTSTATVTGSTGITTAGGFNLITIAAPAITATGLAITRSATLAIVGAPTISGGGTITTALALDIQGGNIATAGLITTYNNIAVGGNGIGSFVKYTRPAQQTNTTVTLATYTTPATDGSYRVWCNVNVTTSTTVTMTVTVAYTDEANVARTLTVPFFLLAGTLVQSITTAQGNIAYESLPITIRTKASTSITIATAGTVTAVVYTGEGFIEQVA